MAGLLVVHQSPPTANGVHFLTTEDEAGLVDVVIQPKLYTRYAGVIRGAGLLVVEGTLQRDGAVLSVLGRRVFRPEGE